MIDADMLRLVGWNQRVLDVGGGEGLARGLIERGCRVVSIVADPSAAQEVAEWSERVVIGDLEQIDIGAEVGDARFDVVVIGDPLTHLVAPQAMLRTLGRLLAPGGYLLASVPNVAHAPLRLALVAGSFPTAALGFDGGAPRRFFTRASLRRLLEGAELAPLHVEAVAADPTDDTPSVANDEVVDFVAAQPDGAGRRLVAVATPFPLRGAIAELIATLSRDRDELVQRVAELIRRPGPPPAGAGLALPLPPAELIERLIAADDGMLLGGEDHYYSCGTSAWRCISQALLAAGVAPPRRILDFACGHGRVMRVLRAAFPEAEIVACDLDRSGVDFCAETFGAIPVYAGESPVGLELPGTFDLIWCGSLLTHMDQHRWPGYLQLFLASLVPDGVVLFTTHGRRQAMAMDENLPNDPSLAGVLHDYRTSGFGYTGPAAYGASLSSPSWVAHQLEAFPGLRLLSFEECGWDNHQDVVTCVRRPL